MIMKNSIGIFDSGFGGLTVLRAITSLMPSYSTIYLGDNARAPYGDRTSDVIYDYTCQGVEFLFKKGCALVILACNTASANALRRLQQEWLPLHYPDKRILGVIIPVVEKLAALPPHTRVGLIGTRATIRSDVYALECAERGAEHIELVQQSCPLLVPLIEEGWDKTIPARKILKTYLRPLKRKDISSLVLGCTHYALIARAIRSIMGTRIRVIEAGPLIAESLRDYLKRHEDINAQLSKKGERIFYSTDCSDRAHALSSRFLGSPITIQCIALS